MGAAGAGLILLSMAPRVGKRRGGAPATTRRDRELDDPADRRFDRDRAADDRTADGRTTTTRGTLEDRR